MANPTWYWDAAVGRYRNTNGTFLSAELVRQFRDNVVDTAKVKGGHIVDSYNQGGLSEAGFKRQMRALIKATYGAEYVYGRGGVKHMTDANWKELGVEVTRQFNYLDKFAGALPELTEKQRAARANMYINGAIQAQSRGLQAAWDIQLPYHPADGGTPCLTNCRCSWEINREGGSTVAHWHTAATPCDGCQGRANESNPWKSSS